MKTCSICKQDKEETEFNFRSKKDNIRYKHCKTCQKTFRRESYVNNLEYYLEKDKIAIQNRRKNRREFIKKFKENKPCADCKIIYPHYVMDFDHLPEFKKEIKIAERGHTCSESRLLIEFQKCEIVCSNCHRIRTYKRKHGG